MIFKLPMLMCDTSHLSEDNKSWLNGLLFFMAPVFHASRWLIMAEEEGGGLWRVAGVGRGCRKCSKLGEQKLADLEGPFASHQFNFGSSGSVKGLD